MEADLASGTKASLTHNDFKPYNILATKPELTVIDCDPRITHPAMCLASTLLRTLTRDESFQKEEAEQILEGYRSITLISDQVLSAAMVLRSMKTLHTWQRKGKKERVVKLTSLMKEHQEKIVS